MKHMKRTSNIRLTVQFLQEGEIVIAYCPSLDLSAQGANIQEAKKAFEETFDLFVEELSKTGKLEDVLEECGWKKVETSQIRNNIRWTPPRYIGNLEEDFALPV